MNILSAELMFPDHVSELARDLLSKILSRSYGERIKGRDIRNHPFFEDVDLENIVKKIDIPPLQPRLLNHDALAAKKDFLRQAATAAHTWEPKHNEGSDQLYTKRRTKPQFELSFE